MKTEVKWWQFLAGILGILATIITIYFSLKSTIVKEAKDYENHEQRINSLENGFREFKIEMREQRTENREWQTKMNDKTEQILILLQNKKDREK